MRHLQPVFDRSPKYGVVGQNPPRTRKNCQLQSHVHRRLGQRETNRGWRVQHSWPLGPFGGPMHLGDTSPRTCYELNRLMRPSPMLDRKELRWRGRRANFEPALASEAEIQRFCQSFMTELQKYVGPGLDLPSMGVNCGSTRDRLHVRSVQEDGYLSQNMASACCGAGACPTRRCTATVPCRSPRVSWRLGSDSLRKAV